MPGYALAPHDVAAVREYLAAVLPVRSTGAASSKSRDGHLVLAERNCLGCHARGLEPGIAALTPALLQIDERLAERIPASAPPALNSVGDKLHDDALRGAITTTSARLRPWLDVRMPKFNLADDELDALLQTLIAEDRIPALPERGETRRDAAGLQLAGSRLVTSSGFGCTSCHAIGDVAPVKVELAARGTDLSELGQRVRRPWYDRWVRNPARIVPRMEMPSVQIPIGGVLDDRLDDQLAAVWHVLNQPDFTPTPPDAVRTVRARNIPGEQRAHVLTDVLEVDDHKFIQPLLVGLPNRHSVLFDLEQNRLAAWWIGDVARQRTRGKTWYWEPAGEFLTGPSTSGSELLIDRDGKVHEPLAVGQFRTECDLWEHAPGGLRFAHRLRFAATNEDSSAAMTLRVEQSYSALAADNGGALRKGFRRRLKLAEAPADTAVRLEIAASPELRVEGLQVAWSTPLGECAIRVAEAAGGRLEIDDRQAWLVIPKRASAGPITIELEYLSTAPLDSFPIEQPPIPTAPPTRLDVVPGFTADRLPITDEIMPTGLAWRPDGTLVFTSLKGEVWQARDTDGDGLEDTAQVIGDDLAAPYGLAAVDDRTLDVINKYALLRLHDDDGDGFAERTERLVSGWGHTDDYHDWAVGLVSDDAGAYYIALPCQQDNRSEAAAHLRGRALKLVPREPAAENPDHFTKHEICAGLRFPMGLAMNAAGDLFASDNQGNYNPFNELNHLGEGERYGFLNRLEARPGFKPPFQPAAVEIPHPWTRSVNGICFLDTPKRVREQSGRDLFGPFEGHLIGCEYDTRGLVRMSLERVGEVYQGAVYPLSTPPVEGTESLLGPVSCAVAPDGDLYIGNLRDSAWGAGANNGSLVRMRREAELPSGIAEVRVTADGFEIAFTQSIDVAAAGMTSNYAVSSFRRIATPDYGGPDRDRRTEKILAAEPGADGHSVRLRLPELREGFVYEFRVQDELAEGARLWPAEAYYTLRRRPE